MLDMLWHVTFPHSEECPKKNDSCDYCKKTSHVRRFCTELKQDEGNDLQEAKSEVELNL